MFLTPSGEPEREFLVDSSQGHDEDKIYASTRHGSNHLGIEWDGKVMDCSINT